MDVVIDLFLSMRLSIRLFCDVPIWVMTQSRLASTCQHHHHHRHHQSCQHLNIFTVWRTVGTLCLIPLLESYEVSTITTFTSQLEILQHKGAETVPGSGRARIWTQGSGSRADALTPRVHRGHGSRGPQGKLCPKPPCDEDRLGHVSDPCSLMTGRAL